MHTDKEMRAEDNKQAGRDGAGKNEFSETGTVTPNQSGKFITSGCAILGRIGTVLVFTVEKIIIPACIPAAAVLFTFAQAEIANDRQKADSADKDRETKEQVLTEYGKAMSELVTKDKLTQESNASVKNIARGHTFIALRRLNESDEPQPENQPLNWFQTFLKGFKEQLSIGSTPRNPDDESDKSNDAGELKGLLIRYLYDAKLIGYDPKLVPDGGNGKYVVDLYGADITKVVLEDAWLPGINLAKAEYNEGNFKNTTLTNAKLYQANFTNANFTGADLGGAIFTNANLTGANFTGANLDPKQIKQACYWDKAIYTSEQQQELDSLPTEPENPYCSKQWKD